MCPDIPVFSLTQTQHPSVIVWVDDSGVAHARDTRTGNIIVEGSDHASVINAALNALTPNRTWKERVALRGNFVLRDTIRVPSWTTLDLREAFMYAADGLNKKMIVNANAEAGGDVMIDIVGGHLNGNKSKQTGGEGIHLKNASYCVIHGVNVYRTKYEGILLTTCHNVLVSDTVATECDITGLVAEINSYHVSVENCQFINNEYYGFAFEGVDGACYQCNASNVICAGNKKNGVLVDRCNQIELSNVLSVSNGQSGFAIAGCRDCTFANCIAQGNGLDGFSVYQIDSTPPKSVLFAGCVSVRNGPNNVGFRLQSGSRDIALIGCIAKNETYAGVRLESATYCRVIGCMIFDDQASPSQVVGVEEIGTANYNVIAYNLFYGNKTAHVVKAGANTVVRRNTGYPTEASGAATIPAGQTSVTVNHGLPQAPTKVLVTPTGNLGAVWVENITSTTFSIRCSTAPAADTVVYWYAEV